MSRPGCPTGISLSGHPARPGPSAWAGRLVRPAEPAHRTAFPAFAMEIVMPSARQRTVLLAATTAGVLVATASVGVVVASAAAAGCRVDYTVTNQWQGGFGANVTVTNLGDPVNGWTLAWTFTAGQQVTQAWNATVTQNGGQVTRHERRLQRRRSPPTAPPSFGFNGSWTGSNPVPTCFTLNGITCTGAPSPRRPPPRRRPPSPTTSTPPTTPPTTSTPSPPPRRRPSRWRTSTGA